MPDFDSFERLFKAVMASEITIGEGATRIFGLPEANKVQVVKGKSQVELKDFLARARLALLSHFGDDASFTSSNNNAEGKDLFETRTKTHIELKSGKAMTDANSGLGSISWAIGDSQGRLSEIMSKSVDERRRLVLLDASKASIEVSKQHEMDELFSIFESQMRPGPAPKTLEHFIRCVAMGLTKGPEIQGAYSGNAAGAIPLLLRANWAAGLELYSKPFRLDESIDITRIERTKTRAQVVLKGSKSGRLAKLYPHHRNSWTAPNGQKYDADNWVSTGSFQVWISAE